MYKLFFKRAIDVFGALFLLVVLSPLIIFVIIWLHFANKGAGVFFYQERPGKDEKIFKVIKFKSMTDERDANGELLDDELRLTKAGRFVRTTSIDELPQVINILKGDMSFIGPRPLLPRYLPYYTDRERLRHTVRPGMTGLAQVNGRNKMDWNSRLELDAQYVETLSFINDVKIVFKTLVNVIKKENIEVLPTGMYLDEERRNKQQ
ncbi:MAG: sugar transferase [Bacteroidales bacterium]|jgi:lipopolysaccharide/colanic/teichoic acid biosynthesis glycosyltransferase|nr:sugar transferase [Bacteroidales bacterium]